MNDKGKSILFVISHLHLGGAQKVLTSVANTWANKGANVQVLTLDGRTSGLHKLHASISRVTISGLGKIKSEKYNGISKYSSSDKESVVNIKAKKTKNILTFFANIANYILIFIKLRNFMRKSNADTVVSFITSTNVLSLIASKGCDKRVIVSERNDPLRQSYGFFWNSMRYLLYRKATFVTVNSKAFISAFEKYVPQSKLKYVPNPLWVSSERQPLPPKVEDLSKTIVSVGRLEKQKNHALLLRAFARIHLQFPDWIIVIAGTGQLDGDLRSLAKSLNIGDKVIFSGYVEDMDQLYRNAGLYVLTSEYEGTPNALLEAIFYGIPVIVPDNVPGAVDIVRNEVSGSYFYPGDDKNLSIVISKTIINRTLSIEMAKAAQLSLVEFEQEPVTRSWASLIDG